MNKKAVGDSRGMLN